MEIFPYTGLNDFKFDDSLELIKNKLSEFRRVHEGNRVEMDKEYPTLYVEDIDLYIVFAQNRTRVRYFEMANNIHHLDINLHKESLKQLRHVYYKLDQNLTILDDGIDSPLFGVRISKSSNKGNMVLVYSKEYLSEETVTADDIINFYLK